MMDNVLILSEEEQRKLLAALKPVIYKRLYQRGLLTGEQLNRLLNCITK